MAIVKKMKQHPPLPPSRYEVGIYCRVSTAISLHGAVAQGESENKSENRISMYQSSYGTWRGNSWSKEKPITWWYKSRFERFLSVEKEIRKPGFGGIMDKKKYWIIRLFFVLFTMSVAVAILPCGIIKVHSLFGEITTYICLTTVSTKRLFQKNCGIRCIKKTGNRCQEQAGKSDG